MVYLAFRFQDFLSKNIDHLYFTRPSLVKATPISKKKKKYQLNYLFRHFTSISSKSITKRKLNLLFLSFTTAAYHFYKGVGTRCLVKLYKHFRNVMKARATLLKKI